MNPQSDAAKQILEDVMKQAAENQRTIERAKKKLARLESEQQAILAVRDGLEKMYGVTSTGPRPETTTMAACIDLVLRDQGAPMFTREIVEKLEERKEELGLTAKVYSGAVSAAISRFRGDFGWKEIHEEGKRKQWFRVVTSQDGEITDDTFAESFGEDDTPESEDEGANAA